MPSIHALSDSPWLKAEHLDDEQWHAVIDCVEMAAVGKQMEEQGKTKPVLRLRGWTKALPLNNTNLRQLAKVTGEDDTDNWGGKAVTLFIAPGVGPKGEDGIRFKNTQPAADAAAAAAVPAACQPID